MYGLLSWRVCFKIRKQKSKAVVHITEANFTKNQIIYVLGNTLQQLKYYNLWSQNLREGEGRNLTLQSSMRYWTNDEDKLSLLVFCLEVASCLCANLYKSKWDEKIPLTRILFSSNFRKVLFTVFLENLKIKWSPLVSSKNASYMAKNISTKLSHTSVCNKSSRVNSGLLFLILLWSKSSNSYQLSVIYRLPAVSLNNFM